MNTAAQPPGWPRQEHQVPERMTNSPRGRPLAPGAYTLVGWLAAAAGGPARWGSSRLWGRSAQLMCMPFCFENPHACTL